MIFKNILNVIYSYFNISNIINVKSYNDNIKAKWKHKGKNSAKRLDYFYRHHSIDKYVEHAFITSIQQIAPTSVKLLDVGCGTGVLSIQLYDLGYLVDSIDISASMLNIFRRNIGNRKINIIEHDIFSYDFKNSKYDIVFSRYVLSHYKNFSFFISLLSNLLSPNGYLIFDFMNEDLFRLYKNYSNQSFSSILRNNIGNLSCISINKLRTITRRLNLSIYSIKPLNIFHCNPFFNGNHNVLEFQNNLDDICNNQNLISLFDFISQQNISQNFLFSSHCLLTLKKGDIDVL